MANLNRWIEADRASFCCNWHWQGDFTIEFFLLRLTFPLAQALVWTALRSIGMASSFDGPPVITRRENKSINPIKNPLVMSSCAVRIYLSQLAG